MTTYDDVITSWLDRLLQGSDRKQRWARRVFAEGDVVYSYGNHFELIRCLRDRKGQPAGFLLNGDNYSVSTSRHQNIARNSVDRAVGQRGRVIIPYSALGSAGIDPKDVEIIDSTADNNERWTEVQDFLPPNAIMEWVPRESWIDLTDEDIQAEVDKMTAAKIKEWEDHQKWVRDEKEDKHPGGGSGMRNRYYWTSRYMFEKRPKPATIEDWQAKMKTRYMGGKKSAHTHDELVCWANARKSRQWSLRRTDPGFEYSREHFRHWLGESLIRARIAYTITRTCKWCKGSGRGEGPARAEWVAPSEIREWKHGFEIYPYHRQILTGITEPGHWRDLEWSRPQCPDCHGRGTWRATRHRTAYFLSGFDHQETRRAYFFCELPRGVDPTTVEEAYEALKPDTVKLAEEMGREVRRQGDIFAIPVSISRRELSKQGAAGGRMLELLNTNHCATEVLRVGKLTYARGILHHVPAGRPPDHARVRVGNQWHLILKNTVPLSA